MTRVLHFSNNNGSREYVVFTEELNVNPDRYKLNEMELVSDTTIDDEMPDEFPLNYRLHRQ